MKAYVLYACAVSFMFGQIMAQGSDFVAADTGLLSEVSQMVFSDEVVSHLDEAEGVQPVNEPYRLQCGDRLYMLIYSNETTKRTVLVDPSGNVNYLLAKNVPARGRTIAELRADLTERMATYYRNPLMMISLINVQGDTYSILGEVREPGYKRLLGTPTVLSALCEAKGFNTRLYRDVTVDQADLEKSFMVRNRQFVPIDFVKLVEEGDVSQDIPLKNNDYIYIMPKGLKKIFVLGEVTAPTVFEVVHDTTLAMAISEAGGVTTSASSRVVVIRGSLTYPIRFMVDINRIMKGKAIDFPLEPGDIVYVPPMKFSVLKEIVKMGIANFVSIVASAAGIATYISIQPAASGAAAAAFESVAASNLITPISVP